MISLRRGEVDARMTFFVLSWLTHATLRTTIVKGMLCRGGKERRGKWRRAGAVQRRSKKPVGAARDPIDRWSFALSNCSALFFFWRGEKTWRHLWFFHHHHPHHPLLSPRVLHLVCYPLPLAQSLTYSPHYLPVLPPRRTSLHFPS